MTGQTRPDPAPDTAPAQRASVLVVDDDAGARLVMRAALRKAGYDVRTAGSGHEALESFRLAPSDMVMLDVEMPDLDGYAVCTELRQRAGPLLPIVMVTGMDDLRSVEAAYECGATDFISKPVNWALIGHRVRYLLRGHQALLDLQAAQARNEAILNAIPDLLFEVDIDGRYLDYRAPRANMLPAPAETLLGRTIAEVLPAQAAEVCMAALRSALEHGASSGRQFDLDLPRGRKWFELSVSRKAVAGDEKPKFIMLSRDISARKEAEARVMRLAYFDSLTGLPNRRSFMERVNQSIQRAQRQQGRLAVLFMDLDGFKNINDTLGHAAGDLLLQWTAERLREGLRATDVLTRPQASGPETRRQRPAGAGQDPDDAEEVSLARLGGDEFTALILDIQSPGDALAVAHRIGHLMRRPFLLEGRELNLTTSIGIALYPEDGTEGAVLLKHADTAMYQAKRMGRDNAQLYSASLTDRIVRRMELDSSLRLALDRNEFHLVYQPQIDLRSGRVHAVEALIRWDHPVRGLVSPLEFIPQAEENGLIDRIGQWVLHSACEQAARWNRDGLPVTVAVNLSPLQFSTPGLPQRVHDALTGSGLPPHRLELEVTEGALMDNTLATRQALQALRDFGVQISLDDFGTGYSSLAYLTRMPISHIKVDRCFVNGLLEGGESEAIVRAVLAMAHSLDMRVTGEGVETLAQAQALGALGCDSLQGYYFSAGVPAASIPDLLARRWSIGLPQADDAPREPVMSGQPV